jgi:glycosyltransferase involved in cell wall biosynthesis
MASTLLRTLPSVLSLVRLVRYVRQHQIGIIHTSDRPRDAFVAVLLARLTGARSIVHVHVAYDEAWMNQLLQWSIRRADALIAVSDFVGRTLVAAGNQSERVHVVKNGIDPSRWIPGRTRAAMRRQLGIESSSIVLLTVCRLFSEKGPGLLINAFALARHEEPRMRLLVVGQEMTPGYARELADLASRLQVDDAVEFLGRRDDVTSLMAASDIYAMPSFEEPFGLVFAEAMAMELPVVALDSGGTPEVVAHGTTGLLSQPDDAEALARNLLTLVRDPALRARMGAAGRGRVEEKFTIDRMACEVGRVYSRLRPRPKHRGREPRR